MPATIAPSGPMKFCAGWFAGETWLNQSQDGMSFGVYEISAKNSSVPAKSRTRANTSFHALSLSVRPTAADSNAMQASFNHNSSSASASTASSYSCS